MSITENGKEGKSKVIASCGYLEERLRECSREGVTMADGVETLGVDLRTRVKRLGTKEKARRKKCSARFSLIRKNKAFQKISMKVEEVAQNGSGTSASVESASSGNCPTERLKLRRQMSEAAAGKEESTSFSLFMEVFGLGVEEELSIMATQAWAEGLWIGKWPTEQKEAWRKQIFEVQTWRQVRGLAEGVLCGTRDLRVRWPQWPRDDNVPGSPRNQMDGPNRLPKDRHCIA